jgi:YHS domain-containing protein
VKNKKVPTLVVVAGLVFILSGFALQQGDETAKDPVCGMTVKKASAAATSEYNDKIYYFCSPGCKESFLKDPEKYVQKDQADDVYTCPMHPDVLSDKPGKCPKCGMDLVKKDMPQGQMMGGGMQHMQGRMSPQQGMKESQAAGSGCNCPMMLPDATRTVETTADGIIVRITSKNPETVKKIQEHGAMMRGMTGKDGMKMAGCPMKKGESSGCPMKKSDMANGPMKKSDK